MKQIVPELASEINLILKEKGFSSVNPLVVDNKAFISFIAFVGNHHIVRSVHFCRSLQDYCNKHQLKDSFSVKSLWPDGDTIACTFVSETIETDPFGREKKVKIEQTESLYDTVGEKEDYEGPNRRFCICEFWYLRELLPYVKEQLVLQEDNGPQKGVNGSVKELSANDKKKVRRAKSKSMYKFIVSAERGRSWGMKKNK